MNRLDSNGVLHDIGWNRARLAMDGALRTRTQRLPAPVVLTIDSDELQRAQLAKLIPHLNRLP